MHLHLHILICGWFVDIIIELTYNTNKRNVLRGGNGHIFRFPCWGGDGDAKHLSDKFMERRECYVTVKFYLYYVVLTDSTGWNKMEAPRVSVVITKMKNLD